MPSHPRIQRVADQILEELSDIVQRRLKDPRVGFITLTGVDVTPDLRLARVFVSALEQDDLDQALATLRRAKGFLRTELGRRVRLRHLPDLEFHPDHSAERGRRIETLLRELHERGELGDDAGEE